MVNLLGQFADDMDIYMLNDQLTLDHIFDILEKFKNSAGFTINYNKTQMYCIGSLRDTDAQLVTVNKIKWTNNPINVLGITVAGSEETTMKLNYEAILVKVKAVLKAWACRTLSLIGKINIVNSLVASLFIHKMDLIISQVETEIVLFLWNGHKPKIPIPILQAA